MRTTVFTCGVFDLFHYGHLDFLLRARELGDRLVVGVNSDEYVVAKKGRQPFAPLRERVRMLEALECVHAVHPFWEADPCELILRLSRREREIRPRQPLNWIVAKGSEYTRDNAPEAALIEQLGGEFVTLESLPIHSTDILKRFAA